jgi:hypothetical protein
MKTAAPRTTVEAYLSRTNGAETRHSKFLSSLERRALTVHNCELPKLSRLLHKNRAARLFI